MAKTKTLNFTLCLPIFPYHITFSFGETQEVLENQFKMKLQDFDSEDGLTYHFDNNNVLVRLKHFPKSFQEFGILQHEIFHAVTFVLDDIHIPFKLDVSDETYAYLIGYLTTEVYKKL